MPAQPPQRVRVVHMIYNLGLGGAERQLYELCSRLPRAEFDVSVIRFQELGEYAPRLEAAGVAVHTVAKRSGIDLVFLLRLWRKLRLLQPAVLHCWMHSANLVGALLLPWLKPRPALITAVRNTNENLPRRPGGNFRFQADRSAVMLGNSSEVRNYLLRNGVAPAKLRVIENGISFTRFDEAAAVVERDIVLRREGLDPALPLVLTVGRLVPQKDHRTFITAAKLLLEAGGAAQFAILGDGPLLAETQGWIAEAGLQGRLHILPARPQIEDLLLSCDVFCLASLHEGFPNALAEALACGKPCIATAVSGSSEMIRDGESGSLIAVGDSSALARHIRSYLQDPALAAAHGSAARSLIRANYSVERMVTRYCELYREVLARPAG